MEKLTALLTKSLSYSSKFYLRDRKLQPKLRMRSITPIFPPPGNKLVIPTDMTPESFLWKIGNNCKEYAEKFETLEEVIKSTRKELKEKGLKPRHRRYLLETVEKLRRGILTFDYLKRRTTLEIPEKK